jgi:hypothetical protein
MNYGNVTNRWKAAAIKEIGNWFGYHYSPACNKFSSHGAVTDCPSSSQP